MADPLAPFRKKPAGAAVETPPPKAPDEYLAFDAKDRVERLDIRRVNDPARAPAYAWLLDVAYDDLHGTEFVLLYTFMMVLVRGRNLQPVITALKMSTASFIQEFDSNRWQKPKDENAPFIESIMVVVKEGGPSISETEKSAKEKAQGRSLH